jgi:type II secretory pathway pseudopilin PulG
MTAPRRLARRGFTLVETGLAIVILATAMLAMLSAQEAFYQQNRWGERASQAARLGNEIREMTMALPINDPVTTSATWGPESGESSMADWDDVDDFDGLDVSSTGGTGPIDSTGLAIPGMNNWRQSVTVKSVEPTELETVVADGSSEAVRVSVDVYWQASGSPDELITTVTWVHMQ